MRLPRLALLSLLVLPAGLVATGADVPLAEPGDTRVARWHDDKKAAFMMMFDDCAPTHVTHVHPELQRRGMTGTYYIVGDKPERLSRLEFWDKVAPASPGVVYGNHTMNHRAFTDVENAEREIAECNELIYRVMPGQNPRLISYVSPGGAKHLITQDEINAIIARHHLILRPPFRGHGAGIQFKTGADILRHVDRALAAGAAEYVIFHGVGGDWLTFPLDEFTAMLDGLETRRADLWITDHVSVHQYETLRDTATLRVLDRSPRALRIELASPADPALYDRPLTLVTRVPAGWTRVRVSRVGTRTGASSEVAVTDGLVRYQVRPGSTPVVLEAL